MKRFTVLRVSVGIAVLIAALRLMAPAATELLDLKALDYRYTVRGEIAPGDEVVIVGIDEKSLSEVGRWPWPRTRLAALIDRLNEGGAAVIGLDIILDQPDTTVDMGTLEATVAAAPDLDAKALLNILGPEIEADSLLAGAFRRAEGVVLGHFFELGSEPSVLEPGVVARVPELSVSATGRATPESVSAVVVARAAHLSAPALLDAAAASGHTNVLPDPDGINRRLPLIVRVEDRLSPSLSLSVLQRYRGGEPATVALAPGEVAAIRMGDSVLPADSGGQLWVNYYGLPGTFRHVSAADVLAGRFGAEVSEKIALVGFTALGFDEIATPFHPVVPGIDLQATAVANLLRGDSLWRPRWLVPVEAAFVVLLGLFVGLLLSRLSGGLGWAAALGMVVLYLWGTQWLFETRGLVLTTVYPIAAIVSCTLGAAIYRAVAEEREKREIREAFSHYLNPEVTDLLARDPSQLRLGGERRHVTVFFSDIQDFTTIAESLGPEALGKLLNEYLGAMTDIVFQHEGLLDKYVGDAIMAFWGAPVAAPDHARRCCQAALDMQAALARLHERWAADGVPLMEIRIGIHSGEAMVGNFGSAQRFSYTAMGDTVNLASRLEGVNKRYSTHVLISEGTRHAVGDEFLCREIDRVVVKGRVEPVTVYELLGSAREDSDGQLRRRAEEFGVALAAFRAHTWEEATARFEALARDFPGDRAAVSFLERCRQGRPRA
jgi:adenylate cyclase